MGKVADISVFTPGGQPGAPNPSEGLEVLRQNQTAFMETIGVMPPESLTIADGAISPTSAVCIVDAEGGAHADDLTIINATFSDGSTLHDGMVILLSAKDASRVVTVKNSDAPNGVKTVDGKDIALSPEWSLVLQYVGGVWQQINVAAPLKPATETKLGGVKVGSGITIAPDGTISIDPWDIFPMHVPIAVYGVTFGGSDGRRAIMPWETVARENWVKCDGGSDGVGGTVPDLRGCMILGASDSVPAYSMGGSETHSHSLYGNVGETTLTVEQLANHAHAYTDAHSAEGSGNPSGQSWGYILETKTTWATGSSYAHTHALSGTTGEAGSLPPYYALSYIIRCA